MFFLSTYSDYNIHLSTSIVLDRRSCSVLSVIYYHTIDEVRDEEEGTSKFFSDFFSSHYRLHRYPLTISQRNMIKFCLCYASKVCSTRKRYKQDDIQLEKLAV